ncbi:MAG: hemolysin family protein [Candidatus Peregrinibacteria bacterium]|nr:hemolysin family protein [Candidatus Peregrinibacteria bacterium]
MNDITSDIVVIIALILLNGFFSGTEMAIISLRKTRLKQLVKNGNRNALIIENFKKNPEDLLATIQVGLTLVSTIASAYAATKITVALTPLLEKSSVSFIAQNAEGISLAFIVIMITYLTIIFGELIPKSLAIKFSERFALFAARPIYILSKISFIITKSLTVSSNIILKIFGDKTSFSEGKLSEDEIRIMLHESQESGVIKKYEHEIMENVFEFADIAVGQVMMPRTKIFAIDIDIPVAENIKLIVESGYSRIPMYKDSIDNIVGILNGKDLLQYIERGQRDDVDLLKLSRTPFYVTNTERISALLRKFQKEKIHIAIVTDEYGGVDGLITIEDILEELVGEISDETDMEQKSIRKEKDGNYIVDGDTSIIDFNRYFDALLPEDETYSTISGMLQEAFERLPKIGEKTAIDNLEFTIRDRTNRTILSALVKRLEESDPSVEA